MSLLDGLPALIADAAGGLMRRLDLVKQAAAASDGRGGFARTWGAPIPVSGLITRFSDSRRFEQASAASGQDREPIRVEDRRAVILGAGLPAGVTPAVGDRLRDGASEWAILAVDRDPAAATYSLHLRPAA